MSLPETNGLQRIWVHDEKVQVVTFQVAGTEYAVEVKYVEEINRLINITRVPRAPFYIEGLINIRGSIIPVINLYKKFNLAGQVFNAQTRIIVFRVNAIKAAIIVDKVAEVMHLNVGRIVFDNYFFSPINTELIKGMVKVEDRMMVILDLEKLLDTDK